MNNYPEYLMEILREWENLDAADTSRDAEILQSCTPTEAFGRYLEHEGILGYDHKMKEAIKDIYGVDLDTNKRENAGYTIVGSMEIGNKEIVLGQMDSQYGTKFVTWECTGGGNYYWGHYFDNELEAKADFCRRSMEEFAFQKSLPQKEDHER